MSIRKGNYTRTTTAGGDVLGKVESVARNELTVTTSEGTTATVSRGDSVKINYSDFKAGPILGGLPESITKHLPVVETPTVTESVVRPGREGVRPLKKGTGKKAEALSVYRSLDAPDRKSFTEAMIPHGATAACSSTYFYNIKNGIAGWEV